MVKPIEDKGHLIEATKPLKLKRYEIGKVPDPGQCVDCLIIINDRSDGTPRGRLALSNGASWDHLAWLDELRQTGTAIAPRPAEIDLMPLVRTALAEALPAALVTKPEVKVIQQQQPPSEAIQQLAAAFLEMSEHVNRIALENADLRAETADLAARITFLTKNSVGEVLAV